MKQKITEEDLKTNIPLMVAKLKTIEYLYKSINPSCLKASTVDKFSKESYRIHGLLQNIEDELYSTSLHYKTKITEEIDDVHKLLIDSVIQAMVRSE